MRAHTAIPTGLAASTAAGVVYASLIERNRFVLRRVIIPVLASRAEPLTILHLSDLHMTPGQQRKQAWVRALADLEPDLVVSTGDNIAHHDAVAPTVAALGPLLERPGAFVFGSNDYFEPRPRNPLRYLVRSRAKKPPGRQLPWRDLRDAFTDAGWTDLNNIQGSVTAGGRTIALAGVNDPHIKLDRYERIAGIADAEADLRLALTHSPEPRILDRFAHDRYDIVLAGHTHGGQLRVPFYGALVTNCGLDRRRCRGLSLWNDTWLHVSAGLGTSPYAPVRFACPPEATLLTLVPGPIRAMRAVA
jgi:predicted MPP superfamily phosphohydrolase